MSAAVLADQTKAIARRLFDELWNKGNLAAADELIDANCTHHDPATPDIGTGPAAQKNLVTMYRSAFPDLSVNVHDIIGEGNIAAIRWTSTGTHRGELFGIAPTGNRITITGISLLRTDRGKVAESWGNWDTLGLMRQIGAVK